MFHRTFEETEAFLNEREKMLGMNFGLERMENALRLLNHPERSIPAVHIAGSNGKGSTLTFLKEILMAEGYRVGSFTSPHLEKLNERIMINNLMIRDEQITELLNRLFSVMAEVEKKNSKLTHFEIMTVLAFLYFEQEKPDLILVEAGLGGRVDSTNVLTPMLGIITSISLEHTHILGDTLSKIAEEKAGIIKQGMFVVSGVKDQNASEVIRKKAEDEHATLFRLKSEFTAKRQAAQENFNFTYKEKVLEHLKTQMPGLHQVENASLAIMSALILNKVYHFPVSDQSIREGVEKAVWKGRFEQISENPLIILDGAHNTAGMEVLLNTLEERYPANRKHFIVAALRDKDYQGMIEKLELKAHRMIFTEFDFERAAKADELYRQSAHPSKQVEGNWKKAIETIYQDSGKKDLFVITGSLYFLSVVRNFLMERQGDEGK